MGHFGYFPYVHMEKLMFTLSNSNNSDEHADEVYVLPVKMYAVQSSFLVTVMLPVTCK